MKTRLAKEIGKAQALNAYRALVQRQLEVLADEKTIEIHYSPGDAGTEIRLWLGDSANYYPQLEGGLGTRLYGAIRNAFRRGAGEVICIGGDCPQLDGSHFKQATNLLEDDRDLVLGPTEDGGYYLIGMKRPIPELFEDIPWSTSKTLEVTLKKAKKSSLRVHLLETLYDVDKAEDLNRAISEGRIAKSSIK